MGGAIAIDLAIRHPDADALILQSTFTSMADSIQADVFYRLFPIERLLHQRFDSISKIGDLQVPLLVLHGTADSVVPVELGQQLYQSAPEPKSLFLIPEGDHVRIYAPREGSYIRAIARFVQSEMSLDYGSSVISKGTSVLEPISGVQGLGWSKLRHRNGF